MSEGHNQEVESAAFKKTHYTVIYEQTGKVNRLGHYIPAGSHPCPLCDSWDDPRRISIGLPGHHDIGVCWTCAKPYLEPFLLLLYRPERLGDGEESFIKHYKDPYKKEGDQPPPQLPANHPKVLQEKLTAASVEPPLESSESEQ